MLARDSYSHRGEPALQQPASPAVHVTRLRVRYAETDQMGVVYYANYLIWMEVGRVELVRSCGMNYQELENTEGLYLSVIAVNCRYVYPARYDQEIAVETRVSKVNERLVEFAYRILSLGPDRLLAEGSTRHIWLNRDWRPARLPPQYLARLAATATLETDL
ncbi:MAG: acyl-CoA thioesterase [Acidobacteriaceae bacterium]|nr:acyl-CoA thioesterase [Acidobacteriaceae bacterium]